MSAIIATNAFSVIYAQNKISEKEEEIEKKQSYVISSLKKSIEELKKDKDKEIHENHICQLFGTTVQYNIENNSLFKATPVFITFVTLSETALKIAEYIGVQVIQNKKLEEFPRIKCNINNKEKQV